MNPLTGWLVAGGIIGTLALNVATGFIAYGKGKKAERAIWNEANVETLISSNDSLALHIEAIKATQIENAAREIETGEKIQTVETRIIERIKEVPVEKFIKVAGDCRIGYDLLSVRNAWAEGDSDRTTDRSAQGGYISSYSTETLPRDFISDPP